MDYKLKNQTAELNFLENGQLVLRNLLSGSERTLRWPAFCLGLGEQVITSRHCEAEEPAPAEDTLRLVYRHKPSGLEIAVTYSLWEGGFRKALEITGEAQPTPHRVYVDLQPVADEEVTVVGFEARTAADYAEQDGEEASGGVIPGCGYPLFIGDWFVGMEHAGAFTVHAGENLEAYHHPTWQDTRLASVPVIWGAASAPETVRAALDEYTKTIRLPRLDNFLVSLCTFWSDPYIGSMEYEVSVEGYRRYLKAMLDLGVVPEVLTLDAGWNDRRSVLHFKHDPDDAQLQALAEEVRALGVDLSLWMARNGPMGFDPDWAKTEGYAVGGGLASHYSGDNYLVMLDRHWEKDLGDRLIELIGIIGVRHFKIDWDNECATNARFAGIYPTPEHVREETLNSWARLMGRMRTQSERVATRDGWWPSPWLLPHGTHLFLPNSGDCEYSAGPAKTQRDRSLNHRDAIYYKVFVTDQSPVPLDVIDNHEFAQAPRNPVQGEERTWLDNLVLEFTRGTSYIPLLLCPEGLTDAQGAQLRAVLTWARAHARELLVDGARMVLGDPGAGEVYGFLHPVCSSTPTAAAGAGSPSHSEDPADETEGKPPPAAGAWLVLRNPSPQPQPAHLELTQWLGYEPAAVWQVYPYWEKLSGDRLLVGHEVALLRVFREDPGELSPLPGEPFLVREQNGEYQYLFPGNTTLSEQIGPSVAPLMQLPELAATSLVETSEPGSVTRRWYVTIPHRMAEPELLLTLRGPQAVLDQAVLECSTSRYEGGAHEHFLTVQRLGRKRNHGYGTKRYLEPLGERTRDDYLFTLPSGGRVSVCVELTGEGVEALQWEAWLTGFEAPARQIMHLDHSPLPGPGLPPHAHGFSRALRLPDKQ